MYIIFLYLSLPQVPVALVCESPSPELMHRPLTAEKLSLAMNLDSPGASSSGEQSREGSASGSGGGSGGSGRKGGRQRLPPRTPKSQSGNGGNNNGNESGLGEGVIIAETVSNVSSNTQKTPSNMRSRSPAPGRRAPAR